jgi:hypothetical protein
MTAGISFFCLFLGYILAAIPYVGNLTSIGYIYLMIVLMKTREATRKKLSCDEDFKVGFAILAHIDSNVAYLTLCWAMLISPPLCPQCADCVLSCFCFPCTAAQLNRINKGVDEGDFPKSLIKDTTSAAPDAPAAPAASTAAPAAPDAEKGEATTSAI